MHSLTLLQVGCRGGDPKALRPLIGRTVMFMRAILLAVAVLVPAFWSAPAAEDEKPNVMEGKVVKAAEGKLVMTDKDGKNEHSHFVAKDATITIDGKASKLEDLKPGHMVRVTTKKRDDKVLAVVIEAKKAD